MARSKMRSEVRDLITGFLGMGIDPGDVRYTRKGFRLDYDAIGFSGTVNARTTKKGRVKAFTLTSVADNRTFNSTVQAKGLNGKQMERSLDKNKYQRRYLDALEDFSKGRISDGIDEVESIPGFGDWSISGRALGQYFSFD